MSEGMTAIDADPFKIRVAGGRGVCECGKEADLLQALSESVSGCEAAELLAGPGGLSH